MANINWDEYVTNLEKAGGQTIGPGPSPAEVEARQRRFTSDIAAALSPLPDIRPQGDETGLPALFGIAGGLIPALRPIAAVERATAIAPAAVRPFIPSLVGSTAGTALGTGLESAMLGKSPLQFGQSLIGNVLENAAWDVGGNLLVGIGGKTLKLGKNLFAESAAKEGVDPRVAAQEFLSGRGATLTRSQLTGDDIARSIEEVAKGGFAVGAFRQQQAGVEKAITKGLQEVKDSLQTSDAFQAALKADEPLTRPAGENFKELIETGRRAFKDKYRPFYQNLTESNGVYVDLRGVKKQAQTEYDRFAKSKFKGASADRKAVLEDVLAQDDFVDFGTAHDLRSSFSGAAAELKQPGKGATAKEAAYTKYSSDFEKAMDDAVQLAATTPEDFAKIRSRGLEPVQVPGGPQASTLLNEPSGFNPFTIKTPLSKDTVDEYKRVKNLYREGQQSLYNETIVEALNKSPSKVGAFLADLSESEKFTDLFKALSTVDQYVKQGGKETSAVLGDIKYNFLNANLGTPEKAAQFARNLKDNDELRRSFYKLYRNEAKPLQEVLNAADIGLESGGSAATYLRNKLVGAGVGAGTVVGYLALPTDVQDKIADRLPQAIASAGAIVLTPRLLAKASTSKESMDVLAKLATASQQPKFGGAAAAKLVDQFNKAGIIDSEYINEINALFNAPKAPTTSTETGPVNWDKFITP